MDKPGIPRPKKKKEGYREVTKAIQQVPVKSPQFTGIIIAAENVPLLRIGFATTETVSALSRGMPIIVPMSGDLKGAPDFVVKMNNKEMRCWVRGEPKRIVQPS